MGSITALNEQTGSEVKQYGIHAKKSEMYTHVRQLDVEFKQFFGTEPSIVDRRFILTLAEQSYLPKVILTSSLSLHSSRLQIA
jgi:hypothetical protein